MINHVYEVFKKKNKLNFFLSLVTLLVALNKYSFSFTKVSFLHRIKSKNILSILYNMRTLTL